MILTLYSCEDSVIFEDSCIHLIDHIAPQLIGGLYGVDDGPCVRPDRCNEVALVMVHRHSGISTIRQEEGVATNGARVIWY